MLKEEKTYYFTVSKGIDNQYTEAVKEYQLNEKQKQLLLGEAIHRYQDLPDELKNKFHTHIKTQ